MRSSEEESDVYSNYPRKVFRASNKKKQDDGDKNLEEQRSSSYKNTSESSIQVKIKQTKLN